MKLTKGLKSFLGLTLVLMMITITATGCLTKSTGDPNWDRVLESVKGTSVDFYVWTEDVKAKEWFSTVVKTYVLNTYSVTLNIVEIEKNEYLAMIRDDKLNLRTIGEGDLLWLDPPTFAQMKSEGLLYGPFADQVKNAQTLLSPKSLDYLYVDGFLNEGYALPFNQQQLTFYYNEDITYDPPLTLESLEEIAGATPGRFTYPVPSDPVGGAFVRSVILNFSPAKDFVKAPLTDAQLRELVLPGLNYLKHLKPNMYQSGKSYPQTALELQDLFAKEAIFVAMSMDYRHANALTGESLYPGGTRAFIFGEASVGSKDYLSIPYHSKNKSGAMVVMHALLDLTMQTKKLASKNYQGFPVYDAEVMTAEIRAAVKKALSKKTIPNIADVMEQRQHDIPSQYHKKIEALWREIVLAP